MQVKNEIAKGLHKGLSIQVFQHYLFSRGSCRLQVPFRASEHSTVPRSEPFPSGATHAEETFINLVDAVLEQVLNSFSVYSGSRIDLIF